MAVVSIPTPLRPHTGGLARVEARGATVGEVLNDLGTRHPDFHKRIFARMSLLQYLTVQFFAVTMIALPVKMALRLLFRIKYVWITPWFNV